MEVILPNLWAEEILDLVSSLPSLEGDFLTLGPRATGHTSLNLNVPQRKESSHLAGWFKKMEAAKAGAKK